MAQRITKHLKHAYHKEIQLPRTIVALGSRTSLMLSTSCTDPILAIKNVEDVGEPLMYK